MPAVSSLQPEDKAQIKATVPKTCKILTATVARVFYQRGDRWAYSGIQGGLCLVVDKQKGGVWFRVVDLLVSPKTSRGTMSERRDATAESRFDPIWRWTSGGSPVHLPVLPR
jgi:hypothetical protein